MAFEKYAPIGDAFEKQDQFGRGGLAASGFPYQAEGLSPVNGKIDPVHCLDRTDLFHEKETFGHREMLG
jgi:hypothetical protein